jgi:ribosomal 50S subunit-recycling heat shock protein
MCEAGAVEVNGLRAKSSREVRPGDQITIRQRNRITTVRVLTVPPKPPPKAAAPTLYEIIRAEGTSSVPD